MRSLEHVRRTSGDLRYARLILGLLVIIAVAALHTAMRGKGLFQELSSLRRLWVTSLLAAFGGLGLFLVSTCEALSRAPSPKAGRAMLVRLWLTWWITVGGTPVLVLVLVWVLARLPGDAELWWVALGFAAWLGLTSLLPLADARRIRRGIAALGTGEFPEPTPVEPPQRGRMSSLDSPDASAACRRDIALRAWFSALAAMAMCTGFVFYTFSIEEIIRDVAPKAMIVTSAIVSVIFGTYLHWHFTMMDGGKTRRKSR